MRIASMFIDDETKELKIEVESVLIEESAKLIEIANRIKFPVKCYGKVDSTKTWLWIEIPIKNLDYRDLYFGNDKDVVR